jgi:hypothetical protein
VERLPARSTWSRTGTMKRSSAVRARFRSVRLSNSLLLSCALIYTAALHRPAQSALAEYKGMLLLCSFLSLFSHTFHALLG